MTALIVIGIIIAALVVNFTIGSIAASLMASKVAELSIKETTNGGMLEYEWENSYSRDSKKYSTRWLNSNWVPKPYDNVEWNKTGRTRQPGEIEIKFDQNAFKVSMWAIRWFWFIAVPVHLAASVDNKMIEKYDPSVAERKAKQQDARIKELEKELEIL